MMKFVLFLSLLLCVGVTVSYCYPDYYDMARRRQDDMSSEVLAQILEADVDLQLDNEEVNGNQATVENIFKKALKKVKKFFGGLFKPRKTKTDDEICRSVVGGGFDIFTPKREPEECFPTNRPCRTCDEICKNSDHEGKKWECRSCKKPRNYCTTTKYSQGFCCCSEIPGRLPMVPIDVDIGVPELRPDDSSQLEAKVLAQFLKDELQKDRLEDKQGVSAGGIQENKYFYRVSNKEECRKIVDPGRRIHIPDHSCLGNNCVTCDEVCANLKLDGYSWKCEADEKKLVNFCTSRSFQQGFCCCAAKYKYFNFPNSVRPTVTNC